MRRTRSLATIAVATLVASLLSVAVAAPGTAAGSGHAPVWDEGPGGERYVAFGDSFVSGPGISPQRPGGCARSERSFPSLVADALEVRSFTDASCGGARLTHLWAAQGDNPPQLDALGPDTTLVTFGSLGGNDVGIVGVALDCVLGDCTEESVDHHQKVEDARAVLTSGIRETRERAPGAIVAVVGHGTYLPPGGCPGALPGVSGPEADYLQGLVDHLSDVKQEVAAAEGVAFVDMRDIPGAGDHTACAAPDQQWVRALETYGDGAQLHPSSAGMSAMADQVVKVVRQVWATDPVHPIPVPTEPPADPWVGSPAQAERALDRVRFTVRCHRPGKGPRRVVRFKVRRGEGLVTRVRFRIGGKTLATDRRKPFRRQWRAGRLVDLDGRMRARVTVTAGEAGGRQSVASRTYSTRRPRCLR